MKIDFKIILIEVVFVAPKWLNCKLLGHKKYHVTGYGTYCARCKTILIHG